MADYLRECNSGDIKTDAKTFMQTWCVRCSRKECSLAGFAKNDLLAIRNATWRERFFGEGREADTTIPKFAQIAGLDFPNMIQKAMKLEISERRGDWSVPDVPTFIDPQPKEVEAEVPIEDGVLRQAEEERVASFDEAFRKLSERKSESEEQEPAPEDPEQNAPGDRPSEENEPPRAPKKAEPLDPPAPAPQHPKAQKAVRPNRGNVPNKGEVMLGGAPAPKNVTKPKPEADPWAPPPAAKHKIVKSGARIQFGSEGNIKKVDE